MPADNVVGVWNVNELKAPAADVVMVDGLVVSTAPLKTSFTALVAPNPDPVETVTVVPLL